MNSRNRYHTSVKIAYKLNCLPHDIRWGIPKSTLHRFKQSDYSDVYGIEYARVFNDNQAVFVEMLKSKTSLAICKAVIHVKNTIIKIRLGAVSEFVKMKLIVNAVQNVKSAIGLERACRFFSISRSVYYSYLHQIAHHCIESFSGKCVRRWPNQLSVASVSTMKSLYEDSRFIGWPIASIAYFAKRTGEFVASLQTWYKYAKLLGIEKRPPRCFKKRKTGIRAESPHQVWHADVSVFRTTDNIRSYIYLVVDNFSRHILSWRVSLNLCAKTRRETIKEAYFTYIHNTPHDCILLVDDGSENNNALVDDFINAPGISLRKIIAQRDIHFSNSIVEAVNKIVKYRSLYLKDISNFDELRKHLEEFIPIYNSVRPHISLKGLTPYEVLSGMVPGNVNDLRKAGLISNNNDPQRINRANCTLCIDKSGKTHV